MPKKKLTDKEIKKLKIAKAKSLKNNTIINK